MATPMTELEVAERNRMSNLKLLRTREELMDYRKQLVGRATDCADNCAYEIGQIVLSSFYIPDGEESRP